MGIFKLSGALFISCLLSLPALAQSVYNFNNKLPPGCSSNGSRNEIVCSSLNLQWNDQIEAINQDRRVTVNGDASLENAQIYTDRGNGQLEISVLGNLTTNSGFNAVADFAISGATSIGYNSQITGDINAGESFTSDAEFHLQGNLHSQQDTLLNSRATINGNLSGGNFRSESGVNITGNLNFSGRVEIESAGRVVGNIAAQEVRLLPSQVRIEGNIVARNHVFLGDKSHVFGNVTGHSIETQAASARIDGTLRATDEIELNWAAHVGGDAYARNIENNGATIAGTAYCDTSDGTTPEQCQTPQDGASSQGFCSSFNASSEFGIIGTSGFSYGSNSVINGQAIRPPEDGMTGTPTTPTPSGELDSVAPGFAELEVEFPFELTGGPDIVRGANQGAVTGVEPGSYGRIATRQGGGGDENLISFAGGSLSYTDTSQLYYIEDLDLPGNPATVHFRQGIYFIERITGGNQTFFTVEPGERAIIHIGESFISGNETYLNSDGSPSQLVVNMHPGTTINIGNGNQGTDLFNFNGLIYSPYANTNIVLGNNNEIQGGILSAGTVDVGNNTSFTYTEQVRDEITGAVGCDEPTGPLIDRFQIIQPERILSCRAAPVRVVACANTSCTERFNGPVSVNLQASDTVDWQGGNL
ncbi:MAG: polymer-forming cytoskeletal protein, partial [Idiomarina sp.]|nr:polymer-forming cytoskeletal protein [Idiomarina sp.]